MVDKLGDVWADRDFPVLVEVTRLVDRGGYVIDVDSIVRGTGIDTPDVVRAAHALARRGLVEVISAWGGDVVAFKNVSGQAYLMTGLHPDGDDAVSRLVAAIGQAAELVDDPDERSRLRRFGDAALGVSRTVLADVMAAVITKGALGA